MRRSVVALTVALAVPVVALALAFGGARPALAIDPLVIELPSPAGGAPGSVADLASVPVDAASVGAECTVALTGRNNDSVHPGNDVIVRTGADVVTFADVESAPGPLDRAGGPVILGGAITVQLRFGESGLTSGRWTVRIGDCVPAPPATTTTAWLTTTTAPATTTTTSAPPTTSVVPAPTTTAPVTTSVLAPRPPPSVPPADVGPQPQVLSASQPAPTPPTGLRLPPLGCSSVDCRINGLQHRLRRGTLAVDPPCRIPTTTLVRVSNQTGPTEGPAVRCDMTVGRQAFLRLRIARPADSESAPGTGEAEVTVTTPDGAAQTLAIDVDARMRVTLRHDDRQLDVVSPVPDDPGTAVLVDDIAKGRETVFEMQVRPLEVGELDASLVVEAVEVDPVDGDPIDHQVYRSDVIVTATQDGSGVSGGGGVDGNDRADELAAPAVAPRVATSSGGSFGIVGLSTLLVAVAVAAALGGWQLWSRHQAAASAATGATVATGAGTGAATGLAAGAAAAAVAAPNGSLVISYAREDAAMVERLRTDLAEAGYDTWVDTAAIPGGSTWKREIVDAIGRAGTMVVVLSRHSAASEHVATEVGIARGEGKRVIPVRLDEVELGGELRYDIGSLQHIDLFPASRWGAGLAELLDDLEPSEPDA